MNLNKTGAQINNILDVCNVKNFGAVGDGVIDDTTAIKNAIAAISTNGGNVFFPNGNYLLSDTLTFPNNVTLTGNGRGSTKITLAASMGVKAFALTNYCKIQNMTIVIPTTMAANVIDISVPDSRGNGLEDLHITGGDSASYCAINVENTFNFFFLNIVCAIGLNGVKITNTDNVYTYGNALISMVEISLNKAGRIGWDIEGIIGSKSFNLITFNYISAVTGVGVGSTGLKIRNCSWMVFNIADLEGCATSLDIDGGIGGFTSASGNVFNSIYASANVTIGSGAVNTIFVGGRIYGTLTDGANLAGKNTHYIGTMGSDGLSLAMREQLISHAPRFSQQGATLRLKNQTGGQIDKGMLVRIAGVDFGVQLTTNAIPDWVGIALVNVASAAEADFGYSGIFYVLSTTTVTRGDYMVVDVTVAGKVASIGKTLTGGSKFVGVAVETIATPGLVAVILGTTNPGA